MKTSYECFLTRRERQYGAKFDPSCLSAKFVPFLNSEQRIRVRFSYGEEKTGTVSVTTGWKPVFLLMARSNSMGSSDILGDDDQIIAVKKGRKYEDVG